jgi:hypothetical protein
MIEYILEKMKNISEGIVDFLLLCGELGSMLFEIFLIIFLVVTIPIWIIPYLIIEKKS